MSIFKKATDGLSKIQAAADETKLDELVGAILAETPFGKVGRIIKNFSEILKTDEDEDAIAEAMRKATPEQKVALAEFAAREMEAREATAQEKERTTQRDMQEATARHAVDSASESALARTWRPIVGYIVIGLFVIDHIAWRVSDLRGGNATPSELLTDITYAVIGFYFGSRGLQHIGKSFAAKWSGRLK